MKTIDIVKRSRRNLGRAKGRTFLTALAISVGAFTVSLAMGLGAGGRALIDDVMAIMGDKTAISVMHSSKSTPDQSSVKDYDESAEGAPADTSGAYDILPPLSSGEIKKIENIEHVKEVRPVVALDDPEYVVNEVGKKKTVGVSVKDDRTKVDAKAGAMKDYRLQKGEIFVPENAVKELGFSSNQDAIGKTLTLHYEKKETGESKDVPLKVAAVIAKPDLAPFFSDTLRISTEDGRDIMNFVTDNRLRVYSAWVEVDDEKNVDAVAAELRKMGGYTVMTEADARNEATRVINVAQWALVAFGALALLASVFGIINTMYISVLERTRQIGLMKALGASRRDIARMFRYESAWVGFLGAVIGIVLAFLVSLLNPILTSFMKLEDSVKLIIIEPHTSLMIILGLMLLAMISGFLPSRRAAKLDPIAALRVE